MPPDDPLGRHGPSLENFLRKRPVIPEHRKQPCPYGNKKCLVMFLIKCMLISYAAEDVCSCIVELDKKNCMRINAFYSSSMTKKLHIFSSIRKKVHIWPQVQVLSP